MKASPSAARSGRRSSATISYVDWVTGALGQYTTDILAMIEEGNRVSGKMRFYGYHRQELFGVAPSGRHVWWIGIPIFTFEGQKVRDLFVLGDIYGLIARLNEATMSVNRT